MKETIFKSVAPLTNCRHLDFEERTQKSCTPIELNWKLTKFRLIEALSVTEIDHRNIELGVEGCSELDKEWEQ